MTNLQQPGMIMEYQNAGSAIESGDVVVIGDRCAIAMVDIAATTGAGSVALHGAISMAKDGDEAFDQGDWLYYDSADGTVTKTATGNVPFGIAFEDAAEAATSCVALLCPHPKRASNVAALAQDISASPTEAEVQAISTKVDAILTALKAAGLMKNA